ncbi:LysE family translocator [Photobacterium sp. TY1-4]|uniref:LysE family translocator n=1 Tax=Photobacterium sp. TY1-4 TaxID=2899122 RepID=UPI0021C0135E|nr:LysE family transporter [Photobacterium sp. TY1-4]UXI03442.1 LysE family transporter [Photobacterium sp. TY1-4]
MTDIILYAFGVMYTPGPVNAIGLNHGIQKQTRIFGFFAGVAVAMFILFFSVALIGEQMMNDSLMKSASVLGSLYIFWLAYKIYSAQVDEQSRGEARTLTFQDGLFMQLLNPKGITVALPVATVQFPSEGIAGVSLFAWCLGLAVFAFGAPWSYFVCGRLLGSKIQQARYVNAINKLLALLLFVVAANMGIAPLMAWFS